LALFSPAMTRLFAQSAIVNVKPLDASDKDVVTFTLNGTWPNSCVPLSYSVTVSSNSILLQTTNPATICSQVLTPWTLSGTVGKLEAGRYTLIVQFSTAGGGSTELGRRTLTVMNSSLMNELIFPVVVNGVVGVKRHYQTIFTVLNASGS